MTKKQDRARPSARDKVITFRVSEEDFQAGQEKAERRGSTVGKIMRALFWMWAHDEGVPPDEGWPPELQGEDVRAEKRPRGRKPKK